MFIDLTELKKTIKDKDIKYRTLAKELNMPLSKLSKILNGKQKMYLDDYLRLCTFLKVDIKEFIKNKTLQ